MFTFISKGLQKIGIQRERLIKIEGKLQNLDDQIGSFYKKHKGHFFEIMLLQFIGRFLGSIEIFIICYLLGFPIEFIYCLFMASLTILINMAFVFIPGSMGTGS